MNNKTLAILNSARSLEGKKVLYFEGAGMSFYTEEQKNSDVGNFRIRTSFINNEGKQFYLEIGNGYVPDKKGKTTNEMHLRIDHVFNVNEKDEFGHQIYHTYKFDNVSLREVPYMKESIVKWINENLNCDFETIYVLDSMYQYYVHGKTADGKQTYNLMENIDLNHDKASKAREAYENHYNWYTKYRKFPCLSVVDINENFIKIKTHDSESMLNQNGLEREVLINF